MKWKKVKVNKNNIVVDTGTAILIKCPNKNHFSNYKFWISKKLVNEFSKGFVEIVYKDEFTFSCKKNEQTKTLCADDLETMFEPVESYLIVKEPIKVNKEVEIVEELKNEHK